MRILVAVSCLLAACVVHAAGYPEAEISNGLVKAKLYLPDPEKGSYRGTRFDYSGIITSLEYSGHQYFGQWYDKHDPKIHDAITGPVEEFLSGDAALGYSEAKAGGTFVRIGIGTIRKPDEPAFRRFETYEIVDPGKWTTRKGDDWIEFTHVLRSPDGYAYEYTKRLRLIPGRPDLTIDHTLKNTGKKMIETDQYNHNFFVIDNQVTGPDISVQFAFDPKPKVELKNDASVRSKSIAYGRELQKGESVFSELEGFGPTENDYRIRIENRKSGAGVQINGDQPLSKVVFWSIRSTACPEPYVHMRVEPAGDFKWTIRYHFYTLPPR
jgi:hypothetical protein